MNFVLRWLLAWVVIMAIAYLLAAYPNDIVIVLGVGGAYLFGVAATGWALR